MMQEIPNLSPWQTPSPLYNPKEFESLNFSSPGKPLGLILGVDLIDAEYQKGSFPRESIPIDAGSFPATAPLLATAIGKVTPGLVLGVWHGSRPQSYFSCAVGNSIRYPETFPVHTGTLYDLSSLSKLCGVGSLCAVLVDQGILDHSLPVGEVMKERGSSVNQGVLEATVGELLCHSGGFPRGGNILKHVLQEISPELLKMLDGKRGLPPEDHADAISRVVNLPIHERQSLIRTAVLSAGQTYAPGAASIYSDSNYILLGFFLEDFLNQKYALSQPLTHWIQHLVWNPIENHASRYMLQSETLPENLRNHTIAATEACEFRCARDPVLWGEVHDPKTWVAGGFLGSAGVFAPMPDVLNFARAWIDETLISKDTSRTLLSPSKHGNRTVGGWNCSLSASHESGPTLSPSAVMQTGFSGCAVYVDPAQDLVIALMTNQVHFGRGADKRSALTNLRFAVRNAVCQDLARLGILDGTQPGYIAMI